MNHAPPRATSGYPLVALFLLLTANGIMAALLGPAVRAIGSGEVGGKQAVLAAGFSSIVSALIGGVIGVFHYRRGRGLLWGLLVGAVTGAFIGPLMLSPVSAFGSVMALSFGGAIIIVLVTAVFLVTSRK